jgi:hypothetical protein
VGTESAARPLTKVAGTLRVPSAEAPTAVAFLLRRTECAYYVDNSLRELTASWEQVGHIGWRCYEAASERCAEMQKKK